MAWAKLDDSFHDNPKIERVGAEALALFTCGLSYCARNLTDGFIPDTRAARLYPVRRAGKLTRCGSNG